MFKNHCGDKRAGTKKREKGEQNISLMNDATYPRSDMD